MSKVAGWSLARQYFVASLLVLAASMALLGLWVGEQIESRVISNTATITGLFADSIITPHLQTLAGSRQLPPDVVDLLDRLLLDNTLGSRVVAFKVWSLDGEVLYSPNRALIGRRFPIDQGLEQAMSGQLAAEMTDLHEVENEDERAKWSRLVQIYVPTREPRWGRTIAVTEFYQLPDELDRDIASARLGSWALVAGLTAATYLLLAAIVRRGSDTITRQQTALNDQIVELSKLLEQNARLSERVRYAANRTTALNERALRGISADLHDGPGQELAFALLRLDAAAAAAGPGADLEAVRGAVTKALAEIRSISSGLRLPELEALSVAAVAERAVRDFTRLSGVPVRCDTVRAPADAPLAIKIALFRSLQETLSNAGRHGRGVAVCATVAQVGDSLQLEVEDGGPGYTPKPPGERRQPASGLGLEGLRERAQLLGGAFAIQSEPGCGTLVRVSWPLREPAGDL